MAASLPAGQVTFAFTDLEGSTALFHRLGQQRYEALLADHTEIIRSAFRLRRSSASSSGYGIDTS